MYQETINSLDNIFYKAQRHGGQCAVVALDAALGGTLPERIYQEANQLSANHDYLFKLYSQTISQTGGVHRPGFIADNPHAIKKINNGAKLMTNLLQEADLKRGLDQSFVCWLRINDNLHHAVALINGPGESIFSVDTNRPYWVQYTNPNQATQIFSRALTENCVWWVNRRVQEKI